MAELNTEKMAQNIINDLKEKGVFIGRWIPVSERLPEDNRDVLATDGANMFTAWICSKESHHRWGSGDAYFGTPIAWMPLPQPYRKEDA